MRHEKLSLYIMQRERLKEARLSTYHVLAFGLGEPRLNFFQKVFNLAHVQLDLDVREEMSAGDAVPKN